MPCLKSVHIAARCLLVSTATVRTSNFHDRNIRYRIHLFTSRIQPAGTDQTGALQPSQFRDLSAALYPAEESKREQPIHYDRHLVGLQFEEARQADAAPMLLHGRQHWTKPEDFPTLRPLSKNESSSHQALMKGNLEDLKHYGHAISKHPEDSFRRKSLDFSDPTGRAQALDHSAEISAENQKARRSSLARFANFRTSIQSDQDQRKPWQTQKTALSKKFGSTGWLPRKRLSPDTLDGIRALHAQNQDKFTTPVLAGHFKVSPEAIRRILKSKWRPKDQEEQRRRRRWEKRGESIWSQMVEMGIKPPRKWREMGVGMSREWKSTQGKQLQSQINSDGKSSLREPSTFNFRTLTAKEYQSTTPVLLADRIL